MMEVVDALADLSFWDKVMWSALLTWWTMTFVLIAWWIWTALRD